MLKSSILSALLCLAPPAMAWAADEAPAVPAACPPVPTCTCICQTTNTQPSAAPTEAAPAPTEPPAALELPLSPKLLGPQVKSENTTTRHYGLPMAAMDVASIGLFLGGAFGNDEGLIVVSYASFAFGPPMVHLLHGHAGRALTSLGIRAAAGGLAAGAVVWDLTANYCDPDGGHCDGPVLGLTVGTLAVLAAMVVDDAVLARDTVPTQPSVLRSLAPGVSVGPRMAFLSLGGRF